MASLSTQVMNYDTGAEPTLTNSTGTDDCECPTGPGQLFLYFKNTGGSTSVITFTGFTKLTAYGEVLPIPGPMTVPITTGVQMIPLHPDYVNSSSRISFTETNSGATLKVACVRIQ